MKKQFKIVVDCDDVLYDCNGYAVQKLNQEKGYTYKKDDITKWGSLGCGLDERLKYFQDPSFVEHIPVMEGAKEFIRDLSKRAEIFVATSVPASCAGARVSAVIRDFPEIDPGNILIGSRKDMINADMLLDDCPDHIYSSHTTFPVLYRQPWNRQESGVISVSMYPEFLKLVDMILEPNRPKDNDRKPVVLVGPSGSGKNLLAQQFIGTDRYERVVGYTTKLNPIHYHYISPDDFQRKMEAGEFMESSSYMGEMYGTGEQDIEDILGRNKIPLLVMDINGAINMK